MRCVMAAICWCCGFSDVGLLKQCRKCGDWLCKDCKQHHNCC